MKPLPDFTRRLYHFTKSMTVLHSDSRLWIVTETNHVCPCMIHSKIVTWRSPDFHSVASFSPSHVTSSILQTSSKWIRTFWFACKKNPIKTERISHFKNQQPFQFLLLWHITVSHPDGDILPNQSCACTHPTSPCNHTPSHSLGIKPFSTDRKKQIHNSSRWDKLDPLLPIPFTFLPPETRETSTITCTVWSLLTWHWKLRHE